MIALQLAAVRHVKLGCGYDKWHKSLHAIQKSKSKQLQQVAGNNPQTVSMHTLSKHNLPPKNVFAPPPYIPHFNPL